MKNLFNYHFIELSARNKEVKEYPKNLTVILHFRKEGGREFERQTKLRDNREFITPVLP